MSDIKFPNVRVVGMHFRGPDAKAAAAALEPGQILTTEREPDNAFDPNAIKVFYEDLWLGYIEAAQAAWIAPYMDEDEEFTCTVTEVREEQGKKSSNFVPIVEVAQV